VDLKKLLKRDKPEAETYDIERARREYGPLTDLQRSVGWDMLKTHIIAEVNDTIGEWMRGVDDRKQLKLGSRVETLGWVLDLVDSKIALYSIMLRSDGTTSSDEQDGATPFLDPHEDLD